MLIIYSSTVSTGTYSRINVGSPLPICMTAGVASKFMAVPPFDNLCIVMEQQFQRQEMEYGSSS